MRQRRTHLAAALLGAFSLILGASCSSAPIPEESRFEEPSPYFLYLPEDYTRDQAWPLFIGVHGSSTEGQSCWNTWQPFADEKGFVLLCPQLADPDGRLHQLHGNQRLFDIVYQLYLGYSLQPNIFLFGFSGGAQFVQGYAFMNPGYVTGVSVLAAGDNYPPPRSTNRIRFAVIVGDKDHPVTVQNAGDFAALLQDTGYTVGLHVLPGMGHQISREVVEITLDLYDQVVKAR